MKRYTDAEKATYYARKAGGKFMKSSSKPVRRSSTVSISQIWWKEMDKNLDQGYSEKEAYDRTVRKLGKL